MGSVQSTIDCPNCNNDANEDYYYKSNEVIVTCTNCGYYHSYTWKRDEDGKVVLKDPSEGFDVYNLIPVEVLIDKPFGSYSITNSNGSGSFGTLSTEEEYNEFKAEISKLNPGDDIDVINVSRFVDGVIKVETLFHNLDSAGFDLNGVNHFSDELNQVT